MRGSLGTGQPIGGLVGDETSSGNLTRILTTAGCKVGGASRRASTDRSLITGSGLRWIGRFANAKGSKDKGLDLLMTKSAMAPPRRNLPGSASIHASAVPIMPPESFLPSILQRPPWVIKRRDIEDSPLIECVGHLRRPSLQVRSKRPLTINTDGGVTGRNGRLQKGDPGEGIRNQRLRELVPTPKLHTGKTSVTKAKIYINQLETRKSASQSRPISLARPAPDDPAGLPVLKFDTSTYHYKSRRRDQTGIEARLKDICATRVRYGYRRVHVSSCGKGGTST